MQGQVKGAR